ncbi:MAG: tRNA pseudouridine(55) synthase TruB [Actinomycetia bacterium]|nr:tRNA pseudouridine(55) synthase TruB [Actinomycetes bacterium]
MGRARRGATDLNGVLLVDKPTGITSHDVVDCLRRASGEGRIGHAGTLDPMATGLLVVCVGPATKLAEHLTAADKSYLARIIFGTSTATDDREGEVLEQATPPACLADPEYVQSILAAFVGEISQMPPQFSAIKLDGVPAYRLARQGRQAELKARQVRISSLELLAATADSWDISADVSKGTYIRSLARDIGQAVGCPAHLGELRRSAVGQWRVSQAQPLAELEAAARAGSLTEHFLELAVGQ